jgi:hypothetical protein
MLIIRRLMLGAGALALSILLVACNGDAATPGQVQGVLEQEAVTAAASPETAAERAATQSDAAPGAGEVPAPAASETLYPSTHLDSYRVQGRYATTSVLADGSEVRQSVDARGAWVRAGNPYGYDAEFTVTVEAPDDADELVYVLLGENAAVKTHGAWMTAGRQGNELLGDPNGLFDLPAMANLTTGERVGAEEILGIPTIHYRITDPAQFTAITGDAMGETLVSVALDGWVAPEGYVVRYVLAAETHDGAAADAAGELAPVASQQIRIDYALTEANGEVSIAWPADAPPAGDVAIPGFEPGTFPLPDDARLTPGLAALEIETALDENAVERFYAGTLAALGWSFTGEYGVYTATKDDLVLTLLVSATSSAEGGSTIYVFRGAP